MGKPIITRTQIEQIVEMRSQGKSMSAIASELGIPAHRVKYHARSHGLGGRISAQVSQWGDLVQRESRFMDNMESNGHSGRLIYISGYDGCESTVILTCRLCGHTFKHGAQFARKRIVVKCEGCALISWATRTVNAGERRKAAAEKLAQEELARRAARDARIKRQTRACVQCGTAFVAKGASLTCSAECKRKRMNRYGELFKRAKRHRVTEYDNTISLERLRLRDRDRCHICRRRVDAYDYTVTAAGHFVVGGRYPSIDHVFPISKGGTHTWDNVKLAHHRCNTLKRNEVA